MPGHVGVSTKYVVAGLNDGHGGALSITFVVECRCRRAVSLGMPAPYKPATLWAQEDWVQKRNQLFSVLLAIQVAKNEGWTKAAWVRENTKVRQKHLKLKENADAIINKLKQKWTLHTSQVAHQAGAYPGFSSVKRLGVFLLPPGWDASPSQSYPQFLFRQYNPFTHLGGKRHFES